MKSYEENVGCIDIDPTSDEYIEFVNVVLERSFTQAQIAGLINYCDTYSDNNTITLDLLKQAFETRVDSINNANKIAIKGGKLSDSQGLSDEAMANLSKKNKG